MRGGRGSPDARWRILSGPCRFLPGTRGGQVSCGGDAVRWDAGLLPLRAGCVDRVVSDLPFGVRCGGGGGCSRGMWVFGINRVVGFEAYLDCLGCGVWGSLCRDFVCMEIWIHVLGWHVQRSEPGMVYGSLLERSVEKHFEVPTAENRDLTLPLPPVRQRKGEGAAVSKSAASGEGEMVTIW